MHSGTWRKDSRDNFAPPLGYLAKDNRDANGDANEAPPGVLLLLDSRALQRECLIECLITHGLELETVPCSTIHDVRTYKPSGSLPSVILFCLGSRKTTDPSVANELTALVEEFRPIPVLVLAESEELVHVVKALECGAKGYIPESTRISVCAEAINLAIAGGVYVPATSLLSMRKAITHGSEAEPAPMSGMFTQRQQEVIMALRRGKANKIIAYELNLRESTVKVHIRNIMKKLKATNRTEVAYKLSELFPG
jgi:DNA-binding NarL/FixJ family response regulator